MPIKCLLTARMVHNLTTYYSDNPLTITASNMKYALRPTATPYYNKYWPGLRKDESQLNSQLVIYECNGL